MDWEQPYVLLLALPGLALLLWFDSRSVQPLPPARKRALFVVRCLLLLLALLAIASPARVIRSSERALVFVIDHSQSMGEQGTAAARRLAAQLKRTVPNDVFVGAVSAGIMGRVISPPEKRSGDWKWDGDFSPDAAQTNLAAAVSLAEGIFPAGVSRHVVLITDGQETRGSLEEKAREAALSGLRLHALALAGEARPDARVTQLAASQVRITEGASVDLTATIESSLEGQGRLRLFENGIQVEERALQLAVGETRTVTFSRAPEIRNTYNYRAVLDGFTGDAMPANDEALALVDVRGRPIWLYVEGEESEAHYLTGAMEKEGIRLQVRTPANMPQTLRELSGYDGAILSDVPAHKLGDPWMAALRDYVGKLGGGFVMIGGMNSFGVGGYYRTPVEELLPVKLKAPDQEEQQSSALALVVDRSGSMSGEKLEFCKSAAIATAELLTAKDYLGVYAFDSQVMVVVAMARVPSAGGGSLVAPISGLTPGGGTNIYPGMVEARGALSGTKAKIKHMIVLTDGQSEGQGYEALAAACRAEGITISTVAVGDDAALTLLQSIAAAGGGQTYQARDPASITRIFTQDTMIHTGRLIREEAFQPHMVERHPILKNLTAFDSPALLGYVKTNRKATAQVPLVTDLGDPLLAFWRYDLGKVTAFTSDCKSRWAASWIGGWSGYSQFWAQLLRETARAPQGQNIDLSLRHKGEETVCEVQLLEDAGTFKNDADVQVDVFFVAASTLGSSMKLLTTETLQQVGPGFYRGSFRPQQAGVYLVRARSGAQMVSAGDVFNLSSEAATGRVNASLLERAAKITGGSYFPPGDVPGTLALEGTEVAGYVEWRPWLLQVFVGVFLVEVMLRRWDHVRGIGAQLKVWATRLAPRAFSK